MPLVAKSKLGAGTRVLSEDEMDRLIDLAVGAVRLAIQGPRLCLQSCVLLQRILTRTVPQRPFHLRLGSLHVLPSIQGAGVDPIAFDPRGPEGIDAGFHAWLEDDAELLLDPSVLITLKHDGYDVDGTSYFLDGSRVFDDYGLTFHYEVVPELELLGEKESERALDLEMRLAMTGEPFTFVANRLDVGWKRGLAPQRSV